MAQNLNMGSTLQSVMGAGSTSDIPLTLKDSANANSAVLTVGTGSTAAQIDTTNVFAIKKAGVVVACFTALGVTLNVNSTGNPTTSMCFQVDSTTKGAALPRMTTTQKNAIATPAEGLEVYDLTLHKKCVYNGAAWETITSV